MNLNDKCPVCHSANLQTGLDPNELTFTWFKCNRCGEFTIAQRFSLKGLTDSFDGDTDKELLPYLSAYIRQTFERDKTPVKIDLESWKPLAQGVKAIAIPQRAHKLLVLLANRTPYGGGSAVFDRYTDPPLIGAFNDNELNYLLVYLIHAGLADQVSDQAMRVTVKGWEAVRPVGTGGVADRSFVAMSFSDELRDAYDLGIKPAVVVDCGLPEPIREDRTEHNEKVCDKIIADIATCEFLIADFTFQRGGVYFEAGYALALGRPVIWCCRKDDFENLHFDTRQYNHIEWETPMELRQKLSDRIKATILRGRHDRP